MTVGSYSKMIKQLKPKPAILAKYLKHNKPKERAFGRGTKECLRCGNTHGHIGKYGIDLCRKCFREIATRIGFKKYS